MEKVSCPKCGKVVSYHVPENWDGKVRCPHCGEVFKVPSLDEFFKP